jgi:hypothetical protein
LRSLSHTLPPPPFSLLVRKGFVHGGAWGINLIIIKN